MPPPRRENILFWTKAIFYCSPNCEAHMTPEAPEDVRWDGDVNEAVIAEWKADTSTFDRVSQIVSVTTEPQTASQIADRARVSPPTARKHLSSLVDVGRVKALSTDSGTTYMRSPQTLAMRRISAIHGEHTKDEIVDTIEDLKEQIADLRDEFEVDDVDELALSLEPGEEGWQRVARWRQIEENLDIAQAALALYDFDPDDSRSAAARAAETTADNGTRRLGAFGDVSTETTA